MHSIVIDDLYKTFKIYHNRPKSLKVLLSNKTRMECEKVEVLKGVSFTVETNETFSIIGRNGSGKSTLLRLIAGIYKPDKGSITVNGSVAPLLALGAGFHPDLTGIENVYLNASILGLSKSEVAKRYDSIVEFAELGHFIDQHIRTYSSGMIARLGFSVAVHTDPEILLVDEVLGVGDAAFQLKCEAKIKEIQDSGKTIIFVSHSLGQVRKVSTRAMWLDKGIIRISGDVNQVIDTYLASQGIESQ